MGSGRGHTDLWVWNQSPLPLSGGDDGNLNYVFSGPPDGGHFRVVHARPRPADYDPAKDKDLVPAHEIRERAGGRGVWDRGGNSAFSSAMHKTQTVDYGIVLAGERELVVTGGMESMSNVPYYLRGLRGGVKLGDQTVQDGLIHDGLWCSFGACHMGGHAEYTAAKAGVTRAEADAFALRSHQKAVAAIEAGRFRDEIVPVEVKARRGVSVVDTDESPRADTSPEALAMLPEFLTAQFQHRQALRYGENPHQAAGFYIESGVSPKGIAAAEQLQGKALSYNNINDADAAMECVGQFGGQSA